MNAAQVTFFLVTDTNLDSRHLQRLIGVLTPGAESWRAEVQQKADAWEGEELRLQEEFPGGSIVVDVEKPDFLVGTIFTVTFVPTGRPIPPEPA